MAGPSNASSGGAGGAAGVGFQNLVFAWAASCVVAEVPLTYSIAAGVPIAVGAQTGSGVDDVEVLTDLGNGVFIQAKIKLQLSDDIDSPLAKGLHQAVSQFLSGTVTEPSGSRQFDGGRDAIVLCTDTKAPATVRTNLAEAVRLIASHPAGSALNRELTKPQTTALSVALTHIRRLWAIENGGTAPTDEDLRKFLKCLHILTLDVGKGGADVQAAISVLHRRLENPNQAELALQTLVEAAQDASEQRQWRDRPALILALAHKQITTAVGARYSKAIDTIRDRSSANLAKLQSEALLPVAGGLFISRTAAKTLKDLESRDPILIVGDAGSGKSAVLQDFATSRRDIEEVVVLLAEDVAGANRLDPGTPLLEALLGWSGPPALLAIDGVDALRGSSDREALANMVAGLAGTRWQVIASARTFDTRNSRPLQGAFAGRPVSSVESEVDPLLALVRHLRVGDLSDEDLDREIVEPMPLASLLAEAPPDLRALLRNAFNLRLAADLGDSLTASQHNELLSVRTRVDLLGRYWGWRILDEAAQAREALLERVVKRMVDSRRLQAAKSEPTIQGVDAVALDDLLSRGVLAAIEGPIPGHSRAVAFAHNILFDYAAAIYVLLDVHDPANGLVRRLDADPTLPLVVRPSFDLLVDLLWQRRPDGQFWPTAIAVAGSDHVLASLAIASRVANLAAEADDLLALATQAQLVVDGTMTGHQYLAGQVASAVRAITVVPNAEAVVAPLSRLARALSEQSTASFANAALATDMIRGLQGRIPIGSIQGNDGFHDRALAVANLLDSLRTDPPGREQLAGALIHQVQYLVARSAEVREAITRLLDDQTALAQWGGTVTAWFPDIASKAIETDPELARRLSVTSVTFVETRDEDVTLGGSSVLPLRESRQQQAKFAVYQLGQAFPTLAASDVKVAAEIACDVIDHIEPTQLEMSARQRDDAPEWPVTSPNVTGWIEHSYMMGLSNYWHDDEQEYLKAVADRLLTASKNAASTTLDVLVDRLHVGWAWAALMNEASDPCALFGVLQPAFSSGSLLAHPSTHSQAATLLKAAAQERSIPHGELEAAVSNAIALLERYERGEQAQEVLVGCLDPDRIADERLASRRKALGDTAPEIPPPDSDEGNIVDGRWSAADHDLRGGHATLSPEVEQAAHALEKAINKVGDNHAESDQHLDALAGAFVHAHSAFEAAQEISDTLERLLLDGANRLARDPKITPDHRVAELLVSMLEARSEAENVGRFF
ncbi:hypothetical protein [Nocardioides sp. GCM10030258]|uniref:hypothetical protein n=1 Tax=unclassified Nocardioides TaxID=2615069 RepID=UPI003613E690